MGTAVSLRQQQVTYNTYTGMYTYWSYVEPFTVVCTEYNNDQIVGSFVVIILLSSLNNSIEKLH